METYIADNFEKNPKEMLGHLWEIAVFAIAPFLMQTKMFIH